MLTTQPASVERLRLNVARAGLAGSIVANDFRSSAIVAPLLDGGKDGRLDYWQLSREIETKIIMPNVLKSAKR